MTENDIWELISGEPVLDSYRELPCGNYPDGRVIEEFHVHAGWLHVAFNPRNGNCIDEWVLSEDKPETWLI